MTTAYVRRVPPLLLRTVCGLATLAVSMCAGGCAASNGEGGMLGKALEMVGLGKPAPKVPAEAASFATAKPRQVTLRLHAGQVLNTDRKGQPLSLVARIYKLHGYAVFARTPYDAFRGASVDPRELAGEIVEMQEIVLTPGQKYEVVETMPPEATHIAVVALLRAPDPQRWKFIFDAAQATRTGITMGAHGCALSVAEGEPLMAAPESRRLAGVRCH